jgi:putative SOS response-associated peptidase YedK
MCGRYTREYSWQELFDFLDDRFPGGVDSDRPEELDPSFNVAPTQTSPVAHRDEDSGRAVIRLRRWGLIPHWAKEASIGSRMINARAETAAEKPAFRSAFSKRRCVVPISSFFEWEKIEGQKTKQPWRFVRADGDIILLAGLWDPPNEHAERGTFTILTTQANEFMSRVHDRMPVILEPEDASTWCDPATSADEAAKLLRPAADGVLTRHKVSTRVNTPKNNDPELIQEIR